VVDFTDIAFELVTNSHFVRYKDGRS